MRHPIFHKLFVGISGVTALIPYRIHDYPESLFVECGDVWRCRRCGRSAVSLEECVSGKWLLTKLVCRFGCGARWKGDGYGLFG
jgi:hypothetical protein